MDSNDLKQRMIEEALLILKTVDWLEKQINKRLLEFERAVDDNNYGLAESLKKEVQKLLVKLNRENVNMDEFMIKYKSLINNEKETFLSRASKEEQIPTRSVSPNKRR